jgi:hypothetical protein
VIDLIPETEIGLDRLYDEIESGHGFGPVDAAFPVTSADLAGLLGGRLYVTNVC